MAAPRGIVALVERFHRHRDAYRSGRYNETQLRREFIDPFFKTLGWDVDNEQGYAEAYKDVIHEDAIKVGGLTKAPDYCFRIGGTRKFFVEAKKPSVDIRGDVHPAFQLRRYAWSAKLPLSILTDFEEFAVYDCRVKPARTDKPATGRTLYVNYTEYAERWDEIASIFARDAVLKGSFDKYAESKKRKRGTAEVDEAFLREIEAWREMLARNIALRNPKLTTRELNFAVQRTLDRIIFLRICEDRGIEEYGRLMSLLNVSRVYRRVCELFQAADDRYNSGLFHFRQEKGRVGPPDELTPALAVDDKPLKEIIKNLYYPDSAYEFSVLPADILGQVYEQFLGKVIRLTPGHRALVEDKPEVKKAGGVYYTPTYIVDYIVKHSVGKLLEGRTAKQAAKLRIVDPACGSGSFLIAAYQYLLDWHRDQYLAEGPEKHRKDLYQGPGGEWRLTTAEKKRILLNNIYGVDIDPQAVEVTKLSLLLKVLEGESAETINAQFRLFHERALPDLGNNIKCGNSLIGPDFYDEEQMDLLDEEERYRINAFDWQAEFPGVFKGDDGGFGAVIGNPPYVFGEYHDRLAKEYFQSRYGLAKAQYDTYWLFIERGLRLTARKGRFSMVVPDALLARDEAEETRAMLLASGLERVYHCGLVFQAGVSAAVCVVARGDQAQQLVSDVRQGTVAVVEHLCSRDRFLTDVRKRLLVHASDEEVRILARAQRGSKRIGDLVTISRGEEIGKKDISSSGRTPILAGEDIRRYHLRAPSRFVKRVAKNRELYRPPKIVVVKTGGRCIAALDPFGLVTMQSVYNVHVTHPTLLPEAVLAVLNSRFSSFFINRTFTAYKLLFPQLNQTTLQSIPVPPDIVDNQESLVVLARRMPRLHEQMMEARTDHERIALQRQIDATDRHINLLVYQLYRLTEDDIRVLEESGGQD